MREVGKNEAAERYNALLDFCNLTGLHMEPALKSVSSEIYHASNVLQTRVIDVNRSSVDRSGETDLYRKIVNRDGLKLPWQLIKAEMLELKSLSFVQALCPSIYPLNRKNELFLHQQKCQKMIRANPHDSAFIRRMEAASESIRIEQNSNEVIAYNQNDFLHYRFWFFDLDYGYEVKLEDLKWVLRKLGILPFVSAIVNTSPTKYHIYIKSEMIASKDHVRMWPLAVGSYRLEHLLTPDKLKKLCEQQPKKTGRDWYDVAIRGIPSIHRLDSISIPIPEDAKLVNGAYFGDDNCYNDYVYWWKQINSILGGDPSVFNELRNAQLVGYTNPKNGHTANVVYGNKKAQVLTTKHARTVVRDNIQSWKEKYGCAFYVDTSIKHDFNKRRVDKNKPAIVITNQSQPLNKIETKEVNTKNKKSSKVCIGIPDSPEDYCRIHGLVDEAIWGKDITGQSNNMLLLFGRFAHKHINLNNKEHQRNYYNSVLRPYFYNKISKDLNKRGSINTFFSRFKSLCRHNSVTLQLNPRRPDRVIQQVYTSSIEMQEAWTDMLRDKFGPKHFLVKRESHLKLRAIICDHVVRHSSVTSTGEFDEFSYQIPAVSLRQIHAYKDKIKLYQELGFYKLDDAYKLPKKYGTRIIKSGECKKHTLILKAKANAVEVDVLEKTNNIEHMEQQPNMMNNENNEFDNLDYYKKQRDFAHSVVAEAYSDENDINRKLFEQSYLSESFPDGNSLRLEKILVRDIIQKYSSKNILIEHKQQPQIDELIAVDGKNMLAIRDHYGNEFQFMQSDLSQKYFNSLNKVDKEVIDVHTINYCNSLILNQYNEDIVAIQHFIDSNKKDVPKKEVVDINDVYGKRIKTVLDKHKYEAQLHIENENKNRKHDPILAEELKLQKQGLFDVLREMDSVIEQKENLFSQFREIVIDKEGVLPCGGAFWLHSGALVRDARMDMYKDILPDHLKSMWGVPIKLQEKEDSFNPSIKDYVYRILYLRNTLPIDPNDDYTYLKKTRSRNKFVLSLLAML